MMISLGYSKNFANPSRKWPEFIALACLNPAISIAPLKITITAV